MNNYVAIIKELQCNNSVDKTQLQLHYVNFILMHICTVALNAIVLSRLLSSSVNDNKYAILTRNCLNVRYYVLQALLFYKYHINYKMVIKVSTEGKHIDHL